MLNFIKYVKVWQINEVFNIGGGYIQNQYITKYREYLTGTCKLEERNSQGWVTRVHKSEKTNVRLRWNPKDINNDGADHQKN